MVGEGIYCFEVESMDMERLNRVMRRVRGEEGPSCPLNGDRGILISLIQAEDSSLREYDRLRQRCNGRPRVILTQLWEDEQRHHRDLQAEYLARYGDTLLPEKDMPTMENRGVMTMVGKLREQELSGAESYRRAAGDTVDHRLALLYEKHAREEERHAHALTELLRRAMR